VTQDVAGGGLLLLKTNLINDDDDGDADRWLACAAAPVLTQKHHMPLQT
jgi:hypothetical protein